ncbi:MAG TPA: sulfurtransferase TusA family protein [Candidatus Binataceae bacterium]|jgi:TusA-related sulfurtransferase|nr:sulfurtransferase TusA family protein [Candidatus Binataceae bacterium]
MPSAKNDSFPSDADTLRLDLRGVKCPLNWAHAKVRLESMRRGETLELTMDDPRGARDIPRAAEAEGYAVGEVQSVDGVWHLRIEK